MHALIVYCVQYPNSRVRRTFVKIIATGERNVFAANENKSGGF